MYFLPTIRRARRRLLVAALVMLAFTAVLPATAASAAPVVTSFTATVTDRNLVTLTWSSTGGNSHGLTYIYGPRISGAQAPDVGFGGPSGTRSFRAPAGRITYQLLVADDSGARALGTAVVEIFEPLSPTVGGTNPLRRNFFAAPASASFPLSAPGSPVHFTVTRPNGTVVTLPASGGAATLTIPAADVALLAEGPNTYQISACHRGTTTLPNQPATAPNTYCGRPSRASIWVEGSRFDGPYRELLTTAEAAQGLDLTWQGGGTYWFVDVDGSPFGGALQTRGITIPGAMLTPGLHTVALSSCTLAAGCNGQEVVKATVAGTVTSLNAVYSTVLGGGGVWSGLGFVQPASGSPVKHFPRGNGTIVAHHVAVGAQVQVGDPIATVQRTRNTFETKEIIVGQDAQWDVRHWSEDFTPASRTHDLRPLRNLQNLIDVTFDDQGDLWAFSENGGTVAEVSGTTVTAHATPTLRTLTGPDLTFTRVKPFRYMGNRHVLSGAAERMIFADGRVWWVQGGDFVSPQPGNHTRIAGFDVDGTDDPNTIDDERTCVVNLPGDNNLGEGLAWDGSRIWFSEAHGGGTPKIGWFDPDTIGCGNDYDFDAAYEALADTDPQTVPPPETHPDCTATITTGCVNRTTMPSFVRDVAQLSTDEDGTVWFTDYEGGHIGAFRPNPAPGLPSVAVYPLPEPVRPFSDNYGSMPWQIRTDASYVYFTSYGEGAIGRLDKSMVESGAACGVRQADGTNTCMDMLHFPADDERLYAHSIDLDPAGGRLWFTTHSQVLPTTEFQTAVIGYIDLATWSHGVVYTGLSELTSPRAARDRNTAFAGVAIDPGSGRVGIAGTLEPFVLVPN